MTRDDQIKEEIKNILNKIANSSEQALLDSFLSAYHNSPTFLHFSADGNRRNYEEFKNICTEYYTALDHQKIETTSETINVIELNFVTTGWTGNITAYFKTGNKMIMKNYSVSNLFKKIEGEWKIIHSHESSLPPEITKKG